MTEISKKTRAPRIRKLKTVEAALADMTLTVVGPESTTVETFAMETTAPDTAIDATYTEAQLADAIATVESEDVLLEALDAVAEAQDQVVVVHQAFEDVPLANNTDFDAIIAAIPDDVAIAKAIEIGSAIDERMDFEKAKGNDNIQKSLKKSRAQLATPRAARVLIACSVDPSMINRSVHEGVRYNVYALGKLADAINALSGGKVANAINNACMRSLFAFKKAGLTYTGEMAKASASDKIRVDISLRGALVRHTVSESTSSTQASSTMQALTTLGVVIKSGSHKNPTFDLAPTAVVAKLEAVLAA
jgi:regulator of extracellular matrix RemA (YlzA/DUF370 family)